MTQYNGSWCELATWKVKARCCLQWRCPRPSTRRCRSTSGRRGVGQIGIRRQRPVRLLAVEGLIACRDDQQPSIGQPVDAHRKGWNAGDDLTLCHRDRGQSPRARPSQRTKDGDRASVATRGRRDRSSGFAAQTRKAPLRVVMYRVWSLLTRPLDGEKVIGPEIAERAKGRDRMTTHQVRGATAAEGTVHRVWRWRRPRRAFPQWSAMAPSERGVCCSALPSS